MKTCKNCGTPRITSYYGIIWISEDGYCSVCNHKLKSRIRKKTGMDHFIKTLLIKEADNKHLDYRGRENRVRTRKKELETIKKIDKFI